MAIPVVITDLSSTIASNGPAGSDAPTSADDYLRALSGFIAQLHAGTTKASWSAAFRLPFFDASGNYATSSTFVRDASGNVGIGSAAPVAAVEMANGGFFPRVGFTKNAVGTWYVGGDGAGATNDFQVSLNAAVMLAISSAGDAKVALSASPPALAVNGQMVFNLTSNTNLRISVRGTDGTTRTANVTLA